ncbi:hypothetical protein HK098_006685 [Nowakowskiella sp. JEL0407]|nr:hypothetical protein HK098_006685 [Nowakowskiella sp. JEL0407]
MLASRVLRASAKSSPWGPMSFAGDNWFRNGALPFNPTNRGRFLTVFTILGIVGLGLPFYAVELRLAPSRAALRAQKAAAAAADNE